MNSDVEVIHTLDLDRDQVKRDTFRAMYGRGPMPRVDYRTMSRSKGGDSDSEAKPSDQAAQGGLASQASPPNQHAQEVNPAPFRGTPLAIERTLGVLKEVPRGRQVSGGAL